MSTALQIAVLRARCVARLSIQRAVDLLVAARVAFADAVRFVLSVRSAA